MRQQRDLPESARNQSAEKKMTILGKLACLITHKHRWRRLRKGEAEALMAGGKVGPTESVFNTRYAADVVCAVSPNGGRHEKASAEIRNLSQRQVGQAD